MQKPKIKLQIGVIIFFVISFFWIFCQKVRTPLVPEGQGVSLEIEDVGVTEAWLKISLMLPGGDFIVKILRNNRLLFSQSAAKLDTIVQDSTLLPLHTYRYRAEVWQGAHRVDRSKELTITTMDTTSHDFTWQTFEFGGVNGSSYFNDVAIIDQNDAWAVGEIHTKDTDQWNADSTEWVQPYNAAHWDGEKWELKKIYFYYQNKNLWGPIFSIFSLNKNDVWFGMGSLILWNGSNFKSYKIPDSVFPSRANKMWGTSDNDFYVVGDHGMIAHYDGRQWQRIESGREQPIYDIWGLVGLGTTEEFILCVASDKYQGGGKSIFQVLMNQSIREFETPFVPEAHSIWFKNRHVIYVCGDGVFIYKNGKWKAITGLPKIYTNRVRGNNINDVFIAGDFGVFEHFNGVSWRGYNAIRLSNGIYQGLAVSQNTVVAVGENWGKAVISIGKRNR